MFKTDSKAGGYKSSIGTPKYIYLKENLADLKAVFQLDIQI